MKTDSAVEIAQQLGADRVLDPPGALPQPAARLDPSGPVRPYELEVDGGAAVPGLDLASQHPRARRGRRGPDGRAGSLEIVDSRGKLHNPETDSGGILLGTVAAVGERFSAPPAAGARIATLGSLTLTPLRLEAVTRLDPDSPQVEVAGTAYVFDRAAWAPLPDDLPLGDRARDLRRLRGRVSQTRALAPADGTVCVLGAGHAGKLALAAARDAMEGGTVVAVDVDADAVERVAALGLCDIGVDGRPARPARRARGGARRRRAAGRPHGRRRQRRPAASRRRSC